MNGAKLYSLAQYKLLEVKSRWEYSMSLNGTFHHSAENESDILIVLYNFIICKQADVAIKGPQLKFFWKP